MDGELYSSANVRAEMDLDYVTVAVSKYVPGARWCSGPDSVGLRGSNIGVVAQDGVVCNGVVRLKV